MTDEEDDYIKIKRIGLQKAENELLNIYRKAYQGLEKYVESGRDNIIKYLYSLQEESKNDYLVIEYKNTIIGFAIEYVYYENKNLIGEISEIAVLPEYKNQGIGKILFDFIEYILSQKCDILELEVGQKNYKALNLYKSKGYECYMKDKDWYYMRKYNSVMCNSS